MSIPKDLMKIKLKDESQLDEIGYFLEKVAGAPKKFGNLHSLVRRSDFVAWAVYLNRSNELLVVPHNSITEEIYHEFKECFEVIE